MPEIIRTALDRHQAVCICDEDFRMVFRGERRLIPKDTLVRFLGQQECSDAETGAIGYANVYLILEGPMSGQFFRTIAGSQEDRAVI